MLVTVHQNLACTALPSPQETELLVAGFPCIDVSRAGLRRGLEGQSTGLVRHVFRLLQARASQVPQLPVCGMVQLLNAALYMPSMQTVL
jgi:hypothetical protein